ncbi:uncharacterized protein LOC110843871 [Folsomia candida]|uniref:DUF243 domain-containing protein n=1 Tax=Folsomia candida TaxID=158441 RepID=A0A226ESR8_FOLCA|nr:uncharacterized protein LOC110843871 [Folsomia candida]OXA59831.1 hypothetical protein Fcan01_04283 [Folsomia candida]
MKFLLVLAAIVACAAAQGYGVPSLPSFNNGGSSSSGGDSSQYGAPAHQAQTFRHVYVHTAPDEPEDRQARTIRVPGGDKHVNIIFVKTPSSSSSQQTEVILPEQDEHKNLVYVLLKKGDNTADIKVRRPQAKTPQKPEVYFIRYGAQQSQGYQGGASSGSSSGSSSGFVAAPQPVRTPSSQYGF